MLHKEVMISRNQQQPVESVRLILPIPNHAEVFDFYILPIELLYKIVIAGSIANPDAFLIDEFIFLNPDDLGYFLNLR